jgi:hypothetical protein
MDVRADRTDADRSATTATARAHGNVVDHPWARSRVRRPSRADPRKDGDISHVVLDRRAGTIKQVNDNGETMTAARVAGSSTLSSET